jgi:HD superfamily phosphohydrolase
VYCVEQLVQIANRNQRVYNQSHLLEVQPYAHMLARLCGLIHDLAHMPFGHTLENEGHLAKAEWEDPIRANAYLGAESQMSIAGLIESFLRDAVIREDETKRLVDDLRAYILPNNPDQHPDYPMNLEYPFVADIVGNTLCADLLDYLERDMLYAGMKERSGDRVMRYVAVVTVRPITNDKPPFVRYQATDSSVEGSKGRLALLTYRFESEHRPGGNPRMVTKTEILSEAIDLLRRRFALAEKVYFHRTKVAASAMLISAAGSSSLMRDNEKGERELDVSSIYALSDDEFIGYLEREQSDRTQHLVAAYKDRRLYHPVFQLNYREENDQDQSSVTFWKDMYPKSRDPRWRSAMEEQLERLAGLDPGTIVIYSPDRLMNMKEFEVLVQSHMGAEIKQLRTILEGNRKMEMAAINGRFLQLWRLQVLVDPDGIDVTDYGREDVQDLSRLCEELIGFPNDISELQGRGRRLVDQVARRVIAEYEEQEHTKVPFDASQELVNASRKGSGVEILNAMRDHLRAYMASGNAGSGRDK